ncbi:hypothetical protein BG006_005706 [Podila minutissima]|uniref:Uncharacterized protein n=1 Tax=Podila minutissima TaxID=64525 RepID=A0A9P5SK12_9FUNG|nr:hypothetical protein BG006_005706 [Podila minutissima]
MSTPSSSSKGPSKKLGSLLALAGIAGLAVLGSTLAPADAAITFGAAADTPGSIVNGLLTGMVPKPVSLFDKYLVPGLMNFTGISVDVNTSTRVIVGVNATLLNPFGPVTLPLGAIGLKVFLDGQSLANVTTSDLTLNAGAGPLNVTATIDVADGNTNPGIQTSISNLVTSLFGGVTPSGAPPKLTISGISLSGTEVGLDPFDVPTAGLLPAGPIVKSNATAPTGKPPVFGINGLINPAINFTMPTLNKVIVKAVTGAELIAGVSFTWQNPLNVAIDVPFMAIDIGLNGTNVVNVGIENLFLAPGNMSAETLVHLKFNNEPEAANQLGALVNDFLAGTVNQVVNIGNFTFGAPSAATPTTLLLNSLLGGLDFNLPLLNVSTVAIQGMIMGAIQPHLPIDISQLGSGPSMLSYLQSLAISTAPGHTLLISPKIQVPLPFELDLNIPYFGLDIKLDDSLLGTLFLADLVGTGSGQVAISVGVGIVFQEPSGPIPGTVAKIVNGITTGSSLDIKAGIANMQIGVSPQDAVSTLSTLDFGVPISSLVTGKLSTGDLLGSIMSQTDVTISPNAVAIKVGSLAELTIHEANIAVLPNNLITAAINLDVFLGLPVVANIGYFGLQVSLDGSTLAGVDLTTGLNYGGGKVQMNAGVALSVGTGEAISSKVAALVNAVIAHQPVTSSIGVTGIVIGHSNVDVISALSELSVSLPLGGLLGGNAPGLPAGFLDKLIAQLGLGVSELSLATIPNAGLAIGAKAIFSNPIPISVSVPFIGVRGGLDKVDIVNVGVNDLAIVPGANVLQAGINLNFNNAIEAQQKVATFLGELLGGQLGNTPEALTVHDLRIGASPSDYFDLLSKIDISIPSKDVINKANIDLITAKLGLSGTGAIDSLLNNLKLGAVSLDLNKAPVIDLGASVSVSNFSLNAAVNIGYFGIDLALDNHALARVDVPSITIATANNQLTLAVKASITVQDTPEVQADIGNLFDFFMNNGTTSPVNSLIISRPLVGVSTSDNIQTFALIKYPIALPPLLLKAKAYVNQVLAGAGGLMNNIALSGLVVDLNSPSIIAVQGGLQVKNFTLPADISISYVGVSLGLDATPLADLTVPSLALTSANGALNVNFNALVDVKQSPELNGQIAKLVGAIMYPGQVAPPTNAVIYDPVFGGDKNHLFHILKQIKFNVALAPYLKKIGDLINGGLAGGSGNLLAGLDIGSLVVDLNSPQTIGIDAAISLKNVTIPAEIKLNYVGVNLAIDTIALAQVAVPSFTLKPVAGALSITAHVDVELLPSAALTTAISNLVTGIISNQTTPATNLVISGAVFGGSPTAVFTILQGIAIPINVAPYINKIPALIGGSGPMLDRVAFGALVVDLNSPQTIGVDTSISIKNITLPAQIKLNYVGADIAIGQVPLVKLGVPKFSMNPNNGNLDIALHADLAIQESAGLTATIEALVGAVLGGQPIPSTQVVISGAAFGGSPTNVFTLLQGVKIPIEVSPYLNKMIGSIGSANGTSLLNGIDISNLVVDLNSPQTIGIDAGVSIKNVTLPAEIKLNYVGADIAIGQVPLAKFGIPTFKMTPNNGNLDIVLHANLGIQESAGLTATINGLVGAVLAGQPIPSTQMVISGAVFGGSPTKVFTFLQGIKVPIEISTYLNKFLGSVGSNPAGLLSGVAFSNLVVDLNSPQIIGIDAGVSIKNVTLPAQVKLNYVGADIAIGQVPVAKFGIPTFSMTPNNGNLDIVLHANIAILESDGLTATINGLVHAVMAGQPIPSTQLIISSPAFGASPSKVFTFLQGVKVPIEISTYLNKFLGSVGASNPAALLGSIGFSDLVIDLNSPQVVGIDAGILIKNVTLPAQIKLNYVGANAAINGIPMAQVAVPAFTMAPQGADLALKVHVDISLFSTPQLTKAISDLVGGLIGGQPLPKTDLIISGAVFGGSPTNTFTLLQGVAIPIDVSALVGKLGGAIGGAGSLLNGIGLSGLAINLNNAPVVGIDANIAVSNLTLPAKLNVGYFGLGIGYSGVPLVDVSVPKMVLGNTGNTLTIGTHIDATLMESDASQSVVAALVNAVVAGQTPQGNLIISDIAFGASKGNVFNILKDVQIPIPIAKLLSMVPSTPGTNGTSILDKLILNSADINMKNPPSIGADIDAALVGYSFDAQLLLNYVKIQAFLDSTPLATVNVPGIKLASGNNQVSLVVHSLVDLASGGEIQSKVAAIAQQVMGGGGSQNVNLVVSNIAFGGSAGSVFHILDKVKVAVPLAPYIQKLTGIVGGVIGGTPAAPGAPAFTVKNLEVSAPGANDLSVAVSAAIGGIGSKISVQMPYVGLEVTAGGNGFVYPTINNFQLQNGNVDLTLALPFQPAAKNIIASLSTPVSQLMFSTVGTVPGSVVVNSIKFGASPSQAFDIAAKIGLEIQLNSVFQKAQAYINAHNPLHVNDMNNVLTSTGIQATIVVPGIPLTVPLKMNFPISLSGYHKGNRIVAIQATSMSLGQSPWALGAGITVVQPAFSTAMNSILPNALQWKNALQDVTLGGVTLGSFTGLQGLMITPPEVVLWSPITIPLNQLKVHLSPLGMDFTAAFVNRGPMQVDMGTINVMIEQGAIDVIQVTNLGGPIHLNNGNQNGGNNALAMNAALKFNFLEFFQILGAMFNPSNFKFVFSLRTSSGQEMPWLQDALNGVPAAILNNLLPILAKALSNVKFTL